MPLGTLIGARSGDKGGNANVGFWARTDDAAAWLLGWLDEAAFRALLPEADDLEVSTSTRCPTCARSTSSSTACSVRASPSSTRFDPQAKGLGEYLRSRLVDIPLRLLP